MTIDPPAGLHPKRRRRAAVHLLLPPAGLHRGARRGLPRRSSRRRRRTRSRRSSPIRGCARRATARSARTRASSSRSSRSAWTCAGRARRCRSTDMVNEGVRRAYIDPDNTAARVDRRRPGRARARTRRTTRPRSCTSSSFPATPSTCKIAAKGGGSENKSKFAMLNPSDSIVDWVLKTVPTMGAGWCPPGMLGIGIGGSAEKAMVLAKEALMEPIDMHELAARGPRTTTRGAAHRALRQGERARHRRAGAGRAVDRARRQDPRLPDARRVASRSAMIPNCAATRHAHFTLDGSGAAKLEPPDLARWPDVHWAPSPSARRVDLDTLTRAEVATWKPGETLLLYGKMLTGRDAAHKRIADMLAKGEKLPRRRFHQPRHLLRRPGRPGARRGGRPRRPDHVDAHGQVHRDDARPRRG